MTGSRRYARAMPDGRRLSIFVVHASPLLTDHEPHGDGLIAFAFLRRLAERGHHVDVAAQDVRVRRPLPPGLVVHRIEEGGELGLRRRVRYAVRVRRLFDRLSARRRYDVIHQLNPVDVGLTTFLPHGGVPVVIGPYPPRWPEARRPAPGAAAALQWRLRGAVQWLQQRRAAAVLVFSPAGAENILVRRPGWVRAPLPRLAVVPPGVDLERFAPGDDPPETPRTILFLARLDGHKGPLTLLEAFARVAPVVPDAELVFAGSGALDDVLAARARTGPVAGRVRFLGRVDRDAVPGLLRDATVYCLPSHGEPFGLSALEAMACGRPVVVTDAGGLGDLVPDGAGGKVPPKDAGALAQALTDLLRLSDDELRAIGRRNRVTAEAYSWDAAVDRLEAVYRGLAAGRSSSSS
jgi:glycosyltransferase involved in cell wall biosynthesis